MAKREKKAVEIDTQETVDQTMADWSVAHAKEQKILADIALRHAKDKEQHAEDLASLAAEKERLMNKVQTYSIVNKHLFAEKRSIETPHGRFGFRTGNYAVKYAKGFNKDAVVELLKQNLPDYVVQSYEPDKARLIADRDLPSVSSNLASVGIKIEQGETFFIEAKE